MKLDVLNIDGSKGSTVNLDDAVFGIEPINTLFIKQLRANLPIADKALTLQKTDPKSVAEVKNLESKKAEVLQELVLSGHHYGKAAVLSLVQNPISIQKKQLKKCVDLHVNQFYLIKLKMET